MPNRISVTVNHQMLEVAERLTAEFDQLPAGSVMRCFARAVQVARRSGCPAAALPQTAERMTRLALAERGYPRLGGLQ
jgi:hypothetical protein